MKDFRLSGLIAAPFTPFNADLRLNLAAVPKIASHLVRQGVKGAFIAGTTGEWCSLTEEERLSLAVAWRKAAGPELKLIVHVGHTSVASSEALAAHAEKIGADAIGYLAPTFFRPPTLEALVDCCRRVAGAAPKTPFYYYHMPDMTAVDFRMADFLPLAKAAIPTFRGIKFTHGDLMDFGLTVQAAGSDYDILFGRDEYLLSALVLGAKGAVGSTYNYSAKIYLRMMEAFEAHRLEEARLSQVLIQKTILPLVRHGGLTVGKTFMALAGVDCGPARPPLSPLAPKLVSSLKKDLEAIGFFEAVRC